jgi:hypothetical protein
MDSWFHTVRWMVLGTLTLSACGSSSDGVIASGTGGAGYGNGGITAAAVPAPRAVRPAGLAARTYRERPRGPAT